MSNSPTPEQIAASKRYATKDQTATPFLLSADGPTREWFATQIEALAYARSQFFEAFEIEDGRTGRIVYQEFPRMQWV